MLAAAQSPSQASNLATASLRNTAAVGHGAQIVTERLNQFHGMKRNLVKLELCHIFSAKLLL